MDVHPTKNGINRYWSIANWSPTSQPALLCFFVAWLGFRPVLLERLPVFIICKVLAHLPEVCMSCTTEEPSKIVQPPCPYFVAKVLHFLKLTMFWACIRLRAFLLICDGLGIPRGGFVGFTCRPKRSWKARSCAMLYRHLPCQVRVDPSCVNVRRPRSRRLEGEHA